MRWTTCWDDRSIRRGDTPVPPTFIATATIHGLIDGFLLGAAPFLGPKARLIVEDSHPGALAITRCSRNRCSQRFGRSRHRLSA